MGGPRQFSFAAQSVSSAAFPLKPPSGTAAITFRATSTQIIDDGADNVVALKNAANAQTIRIYASFTDASNYERLSISAASGVMTIAAETAGTGADNVNIMFAAAGTGTVRVSHATSPMMDFYTGSTHRGRWETSGSDVYVTAVTASGQIHLRANAGNSVWTITATGGLISAANFRFSHGTSALATNATDGFFHIQSCNGTPSGTPASIPTGQIPMVYDTAAHKIWFYSGSWRSVAVT